jgi:hypothetical protein
MSKPTEVLEREKLETAIVKAIAGGADRFALICAAVGVDPKGYDNDDFRRVDTVMQRLRKKGQIVLTGKPRRWTVPSDGAGQ